MKKTVVNILKVAISVLLMVFLIKKAHFSKILEEISKISWSSLLGVFLLFIFITFVLSIRWKIVSSPFQRKISLWYFFKYFLYSYFFNNFLPSSIGGDIVRALKIMNHLNERSHGFASVLVDRLLGILATLTYASVGLFFTAHYFKSNKIIYLAILFAAVVGFLMYVLFNYRFYQKIKGRLEKIHFFKVGERIIKLIESIHIFKANKQVLLYGYILSLLAQGLMVILNYLLAVSMGYKPSLEYMFFAIPVSFMVALFPSINGIGVRDWSYVVLFQKVHIPVAAAVSLSFLVLSIQIFLSLFGGIMWIFEKNNPKIETIEDAAEELT